MFGQRALVSLTLGPLAIFLIYQGGWAYLLAVAIFLSLAAVEYAQIMQRLERRVPQVWLLISCWLLYLAAWFSPPGEGRPLAGTLAVVLLAALVYALWRYEIQQSAAAAADWLALTGGIVLLGWLGSHLLLLRQSDPLPGSSGWIWTFLVVLAAWSADSFAFMTGKYLAGRFGFGRHALSPHLSPNKTVEGYVGGVVLGTALTVAIGVFVLRQPWLTTLLLGLLATLIGTAGDLGISLIKRAAGVKDSGRLFPGHGGALDRLDSIVWTVTIAYYFIYLLSSWQHGV